MNKKEYLTPSEVAKLLLVSPVTVRQWAQKGMLVARITAGGHRRFHINDVHEFARRKMGVDLSSGEAVSKDKRILILDDDQQLSQFLSVLLKEKGEHISVERAFNAFEGGMKLVSFNPHILVVNVSMSSVGGVEVCVKCKEEERYKNLFIIALINHEHADLEEQIRFVGANEVLHKPFSNDVILNLCGV